MTLFNAARRLIRPAVRHVAKGAQSTIAHDTRRAARRATQSKLFRKAGQTRRAVVAASVAGVAGAGYVSHKANQMIKASNDLELGLMGHLKHVNSGLNAAHKFDSMSGGNAHKVAFVKGYGRGVAKGLNQLRKTPVSHLMRGITPTHMAVGAGVIGTGYVAHKVAKGVQSKARKIKPLFGSSIKASNELTPRQKADLCLSHGVESLELGLFGESKNKTSGIPGHLFRPVLTGATGSVMTIRHNQGLAEGMKKNSRGIKKLAHYGAAAVGSLAGVAPGIGGVAALHQIRKNNAKGMYGAPRVAGTPKIAASHDLELSAGAIIKHASNGLKHRSVKDYLKMRFAKAIPAAHKAAARIKHVVGREASSIANHGLVVGAVGGVGLHLKTRRKTDTPAESKHRANSSMGAGLGIGYGASMLNHARKAHNFAKAAPHHPMAAMAVGHRNIGAALGVGIGGVGIAHARNAFRKNAASRVQKSAELATSHELTPRQKADLCLGFDRETIEAMLSQ